MINKNKKLFKNKLQMVIYLFLFALFLAGFFYYGSKEYIKVDLDDNLKFSQEYKIVPEDNVFKYVDAHFVYNYLKGDNAMILLGNSNNDWVGYYAKILNEVAKEMNINTIYYYDFTGDRIDNTGTYQSIVDYLKNYIYYLDDGTAELYGPTFIIKKNKAITYYDASTAIMEGSIKTDKYWNNYQINLTKTNLKNVFNDYLGVING